MPFPLYFIAIIPPEPIAAEVVAIKKDIAEKHQSKAALRSPPHITLHMPFRWPDKKLVLLQEFLENFAQAHPALEVKLDGFGAFAPRVIFVNIAPSEILDQLQKELLKGMRRELNIFNGDYKQKAFRPHITVAFRDLKPKHFKLAWDAYHDKTISFSFVANQICLLKHNGKQWDTLEAFNLAKASFEA